MFRDTKLSQYKDRYPNRAVGLDLGGSVMIWWLEIVLGMDLSMADCYMMSLIEVFELDNRTKPYIVRIDC